MATADAGSVVWVGDLGPRVTDAALRGVFSQALPRSRRGALVALRSASRGVGPHAAAA